MGSKRIGKSFLLDSLLTTQAQKVCRFMSKTKLSGVNAPITTAPPGPSDPAFPTPRKSVYLDFSGEPTNELMLWAYFLASVIVFNISAGPNDANSLIELLTFVKNHI
jgi:hypothetical protein